MTIEVPTTETEITAITNVVPSMFIGDGLDLFIAASFADPCADPGTLPTAGIGFPSGVAASMTSCVQRRYTSPRP
jgi:hypothetical protein